MITFLSVKSNSHDESSLMCSALSKTTQEDCGTDGEWSEVSSMSLEALRI